MAKRVKLLAEDLVRIQEERARKRALEEDAAAREEEERAAREQVAMGLAASSVGDAAPERMSVAAEDILCLLHGLFMAALLMSSLVLLFQVSALCSSFARGEDKHMCFQYELNISLSGCAEFFCNSRSAPPQQFESLLLVARQTWHCAAFLPHCRIRIHM